MKINPFLLCLPADKVAAVIQKLDDFQRQHHQCRFRIPDYISEDPARIINAPLYQEEYEMEIQKELSEAPSGEKYHKVK